MNKNFRKPLPGTKLEYFDAQGAVEAIEAGAWEKLPYTSRVLAENLVRRCDPGLLNDALAQLVDRKRDLDTPEGRFELGLDIVAGGGVTRPARVAVGVRADEGREVPLDGGHE